MHMYENLFMCMHHNVGRSIYLSVVDYHRILCMLSWNWHAEAEERYAVIDVSIGVLL